MNGDKKGLSKMAFMLSVASLILAGVVSVFQVNLWLAGTQWILISIVLAVYSVYLDSCNCGMDKERKNDE